MTTTPLEWKNQFQVNTFDDDGSRNDQFQSQVTQLTNGNVLVVWASNADPFAGPGSTDNTDIIGRIFDPLGNAVTGEIQLNSITGGLATSAGFPSIDILPGGGFLVSYRSFFASLSSPNLSLEVDVYDNSGSFQRNIQIADISNLPLGSERLELPRVAVATDNSAIITYGSDGDVLATAFNPSTGAIIGSEFKIADQNVGDFNGADIIRYANDLYVVAFADRDSGVDEVYFALYDENGNAVTVAPILISNATQQASDPRIAKLSNGDIVVSWDVNNSGGTDSGVRFAILENVLFGFSVGATQNPLTTTAGNQVHSSIVALEEGGFVIAWYDENSHDILAQRFDNNGNEVGVEFPIVQYITSEITNIDMAQLEDGRFQVSWTRNTSSNDADVETAIWDPRDTANDIPVYDNNAIISTPSGTINPVPAAGENMYGSDGNDTFWLNTDSPRIGATYDGGDGTDRVGLVGPGTYNFYSGGTDTVFTDVETFQFNAGGSAGLKTALLTDNQALQFETFDFAQGGADKADTLVIADTNSGNTFDLSGLSIVDFESLYDEIRVRGFGGDDNITGTTTNDTILGGTGLDTLDGDGGLDTLDTSDSGYSGDVSINFITGAITSSQGAETAVNFENFSGSSANETVVGTDAHANEMYGGGGNDTFDGGDLSDRLYGEGGNDTFIIREADDIDDGFEIIDGGSGTDTIAVGAGVTGNQTYNLRQDSLSSIEALDFYGALTGSVSVQTAQLTAKQFNDGDISLTSNIDGFDFAGREEILEVFLTSNSEIDLSGLTFSNWNTDDDLVRINGDATGEMITGTITNDEINGNTGDDVMFGFGGRDIINGGSGNDTIYLQGEADKGFGGNNDDTFVVTSIVTHFGSTESHTIDGGNNTDTIDFSSWTDATTLNLGAETWVNDLTGVNIADTIESIENVVGGAGNDTIIGDSNVNELDGGAGSDDLDGGIGADIMRGGIGNEEYYVDDFGDQTIENEGEGYDRTYVNGLASWTLSANNERLTFTDTGNHTGKGNELDNRLEGNAGLDKFLLDSGGADIFSGGSGSDSFDARLSTNGISINLITGIHGGDATGDTFASIEKFFGSNTEDDFMRTGEARADFSGFGGNDTLIGGNSIDKVNGNAGNDTLFGGAARDTLNGGTGNDIMNGGSGRDTFLYVDAAFGEDTITDWQDGTDVFRFFSAVATDFSDFTVTGNGTSTARITLNADTSNFVDIEGSAGSLVTIDANDFTFY
ncbi:hypothetical protein ACFQ14_03870 [Pseudahrensia aquimaris]|uniref:Ca2+-binding protein, RTX toxin-related n=1 Tax=Pseudahrensia aquimaris TaxID=744461 RepID=A0ABW3FFH6_9HYPH